MFNHIGGNNVIDQQDKTTSQTLNPLDNDPLVENPPELELQFSEDAVISGNKSAFPLEIIQSHDVVSKSRYHDIMGEGDE